VAILPDAVRVARDRRGDADADRLELAVDDPRVQSFPAAEGLVDDRLGDARSLRDRLDRRRFVAALGEDLPSDVDQLRPARRGGEPGPWLRLGRLGHVDTCTTQA